MLNLTDLNIIIKFLAVQLQHRIEELQHLAYPLHSQEESPQQYEFISVVSKYSGVTAMSQKQNKLARKLQQRVLQIFQFFRNKSNSQNLLGIIQHKIQQQMTAITNRTPINIGELLSYIHLITKRGCVVKVPAQKKRTFSRLITPKQNRIQSKLGNAISFYNIQRRTPNHTYHKSQKITSPIPSAQEKMKVQDMINGIWQGLELDKNHLLKLRQATQPLLTRDMLRRNDKIIQASRKYEKKCRKATTETYQAQTCILSQLKTNSIKGLWQSKRKRPLLMSKKKQSCYKQNISMF